MHTNGKDEMLTLIFGGTKLDKLKEPRSCRWRNNIKDRNHTNSRDEETRTAVRNAKEANNTLANLLYEVLRILLCLIVESVKIFL